PRQAWGVSTRPLAAPRRRSDAARIRPRVVTLPDDGLCWSGCRRVSRSRTPTVAFSNTVSWRMDGQETRGSARVTGRLGMKPVTDAGRPSVVEISSWGSRIGHWTKVLYQDVVCRPILIMHRTIWLH